MSTPDNTSRDWRATTLARIGELIKEAAPNATEEMKYKKPSNPAGIPVWYDHGMICTGETYKNHLRLTFAKGHLLDDPKGILNRHRAVVIEEGDKLDEESFKELVRQAADLNRQAK